MNNEHIEQLLEKQMNELALLESFTPQQDMPGHIADMFRYWITRAISSEQAFESLSASFSSMTITQKADILRLLACDQITAEERRQVVLKLETKMNIEDARKLADGLRELVRAREVERIQERKGAA